MLKLMHTTQASVRFVCAVHLIFCEYMAFKHKVKLVNWIGNATTILLDVPIVSQPHLADQRDFFNY